LQIPDRSFANLPAAPIDLFNGNGGSAGFENEPDAIQRMLAAVR
jgi:hypothetical protein